MAVPSQEAYDPAVHPNKGDVAVDDPAPPSIIKITIKQSKTDPFRKGMNIFLGKTSSDLCPVAAIFNYLLERGSQKGPLFLLSDGKFLTRQHVRELLFLFHSYSNAATRARASYCPSWVADLY